MWAHRMPARSGLTWRTGRRPTAASTARVPCIRPTAELLDTRSMARSMARSTRPTGPVIPSTERVPRPTRPATVGIRPTRRTAIPRIPRCTGAVIAIPTARPDIKAHIRRAIRAIARMAPRDMVTPDMAPMEPLVMGMEPVLEPIIMVDSIDICVDFRRLSMLATFVLNLHSKSRRNKT